MHKFGFKIVDRCAYLLEPILTYAVAHGRPVEVGLYFGDSAALDLLGQRLCGAGIPVNAHTHHEHCHAFNLNKTYRQLEAHIRLARSLGSAYSVLHTGGLPMTLRVARRSALMALLLDNLARAEEICEATDYRLHLENVFDPLCFYRELFERAHSRGLKRMHFCFDIGHAKVWSTENLDQWMGFLQELSAMGFGLHCHLHANGGLSDEHLSMGEAAELHISDPDGYFNPYGYPEAFWLLDRRFPGAAKVFEVKPEHAIANLEAVLAHSRPQGTRSSGSPEIGACRFQE